jgi:hypothetical protein
MRQSTLDLIDEVSRKRTELDALLDRLAAEMRDEQVPQPFDTSPYEVWPGSTTWHDLPRW